MKKSSTRSHWLVIAAILILTCVATVKSQTGKRNPRSVEAKTAVPSSTPEVKTTKRNERPAGADNGADPSSRDEAAAGNGSFNYEFTQPDFVNSRIVITHDDKGKGTISFERKGYDEPFSDPLQVSPTALDRIRSLLDALRFFDSTESYQYEKDYSHLGTVSFKFKREGRERAVSYNYTTKKEARELADEYRRLANQYIWMFDIGVARENQPLSAPGLLTALDSLFRRNEVSDKQQMLPLLRDLANDERIPLIARNHAARLIKQIDKAKF